MVPGFFKKVDDAVASIRKKTKAISPGVGIILGSGLSGFTDSIEGINIRFREIRGFPKPVYKGQYCIKGQSGVLKINDECAIFSGRLHYYQGYEISDVVLPVYILHELGVRLLIITNAAGGINPSFKTGELVLIADHINLTGVNPLRGPYEQRQGVQFPDMSDLYAKQLRDMARNCLAKDCGVPDLKEGVYAGLAGPNYETPAEVRMLKTLGADMVGMSTVSEAAAAASLSMKVLGISCIVNMAAGTGMEKLTHDEVVAAGKKATADLSTLVTDFLNQYRSAAL